MRGLERFDMQKQQMWASIGSMTPWIILVLVLLANLGFAVPWTATLESGDGMASCFIFAEGKALASAGDEVKYDICVEPWTYPGWCTNYLDMGEVSLDSLTVPPASGYNDDLKGFEDCEKVEANHAYWIKTRDGKYAKVKVTEATHLGSAPGGNLNRVTFNWVYFDAGVASGTEAAKPPGDNPCPVAVFGLLMLGLGTLYALYIPKSRN